MAAQTPQQTVPEEEPRPARWWIEAVIREEKRGELLVAFDLAERGLAEHPDALELKHRAVLSLARAGATQEAARRFRDYGLAGIRDEDIAALRARIAKDIALASDGDERSRRAARAAELYASVLADTGGYYPAVNAASLWLLAGDVARSRELAKLVLESLARSGDDSYYHHASAAEAFLLLGEEQAAAEALQVAAANHGDDYAALATTRRQLRAVCEALKVDAGLLGALAGPAVVHFCGHRISEARGERFSRDAEAGTAAQIAEVVDGHQAGFAYGALAAGADIMWAEALLARGSELHVVLPFSLEEFRALSVAPSGRAWEERFERCLAAATSVRFATDDAFLGDDVLFRYGSELAMGLALLRARYLDAEVTQLAVWDGKPADGAAGTAIDVATWTKAGQRSTIVRPAGGSDPVLAPPATCAHASARGGRVVRALLFGDVKGFSKLTDEQLPLFASHVLAAFATVANRYEHDVWHRNSWGDALYVVLSDAAAAASCALDLQEAMKSLELETVGLPAHLALRLGGHVGPVFPVHDPVLNAPAFMGSHVSRTARVEPVTPPGAVYVTEPFAAALVLADRQEFACDYVGHMQAAKDYGRLRMYRLRRAATGDSEV